MLFRSCSQALKQRFIRDYGLSDYDVEIFSPGKPLADYFGGLFKIYPCGQEYQQLAYRAAK